MESLGRFTGPHFHYTTIREWQQWFLSAVAGLVLMSVLGALMAVWFPFTPVRNRIIVLSSAITESPPELVVAKAISVSEPPQEAEPPLEIGPKTLHLDTLSVSDLTVSAAIDNEGAVAETPVAQSGDWDAAGAPGAGDPFNSPGGGLARPGQFHGETLLAWTNEPYVIKEIFPDHNPLWEHLDRMGFQVRRVSGQFDRHDLVGARQVWVFASARSGMVYEDYKAVVEFVRHGGGLYLCSDNDPYLAESVELCRRLFGCRVRGNYRGQQLLGILNERGRRPAIRGPSGQVKIASRNWQRPHALLSGLRCLYEGDTISTITNSKLLTTVLRASNGQILAAVGRPGRRVCVDGGYTRYNPAYYQSGSEQGAGVALWATNLAAYLGGVTESVPVAPGGADEEVPERDLCLLPKFEFRTSEGE